MKFRIDLKDTDGVWDGVTEAVKKQLPSGLTFAEEKQMIRDRRALVFEEIEEWVKHQEYITIEFDTDARTATVVPNR